MEFINVPLFDEDFYKMLVRFLINSAFLVVIIRYLYYRNTHNKDYLFTYFMISMVVFFICFTLKKFDLEIGMALGLFAIFGIVRYRTDAIPIKEMTYLFIVIGVSVINSLSNKKMSYAELAFANGAIVVFTALLERFWFQRHELSKHIIFEEIELIKPENYNVLKENLERRTGLVINRIVVGKVDFLKDVADLTIFYHADNQKGTLGEGLKQKI